MASKDKKEETIVDVQGLYTRTEKFVDQNRKVLSIGLGAIAVAVAGVFAYIYLVRNPKQEEAANAIWRAQQYFELDSLNLAMNGNGSDLGFEDIASDFSGTPSGRLAEYYLGVIYRDRGEYETALDHFKNADFNDNAIGVIAMGNVGDMYIELGQQEEGAKWLEKAARKASASKARRFLAPVFLLKASKVYMELGNDKKAHSMLKEIKDDYTGVAAVNAEVAEATKLEAMLSGRE